MFEGEYTEAELIEAIGQEAFDKLRYYTDAVDHGLKNNWWHLISTIDVADEDGDTYEVRAIYKFTRYQMAQVERLDQLDWEDPIYEIEQVG